jgi:hypothetical protein
MVHSAAFGSLARQARSPSTMAGNAFRGIPGRPYTTIVLERGTGGAAIAARSAGSRRGSKANSCSNSIPDAWKWSRRSDVLKIAIVSAEASYVARASSHWADHAKNPGSKSWMTYPARAGGRPDAYEQFSYRCCAGEAA